MSLVIGLDTGGTYTDAALLDAANGHVLAAGAYGEVCRSGLATPAAGSGRLHGKRQPNGLDGRRQMGDIGLVSLSTTLATNASRGCWRAHWAGDDWL